jgi:hypothetical protein
MVPMMLIMGCISSRKMVEIACSLLTLHQTQRILHGMIQDAP